MAKRNAAPSLVILSAPSGAGKTTLCARLLKDFPAYLELSISATTREPRGTEKHGTHYFFLPKGEFERKMREGAFAEWADVHGNYYGTLRETIDKAFDRGRSVLLDIDVQGAASLRAAYPGKFLSIFVAPPSLEELKNRLLKRGTDSPETIERRLKNAAKEMERQKEFEHVLVNGDLEEAYDKLCSLVETRLGVKRV